MGEVKTIDDTLEVALQQHHVSSLHRNVGPRPQRQRQLRLEGQYSSIPPPGHHQNVTFPITAQFHHSNG